MDIDLFSGKRRRGTVTKQPPPSALSTRPSLRKHSSQSILQRAPSDPVYTRSTTTSHSNHEFHQRSQSNAHGSSTSSLVPSSRQSPVNNSGEFFPTFSNAYQSPSTYPSLLHSSSNQVAAFTMQNSANSVSRPSAPQQSITSPDLRFHQLRQSQGYSGGIVGAMETTPPRSENGTLSPKRFSGETQMSKPVRSHRKKSGFSSFMNSMLGSPRGIKISAPENPTHITHVCFDNKTGQFTVSESREEGTLRREMPYCILI